MLVNCEDCSKKLAAGKSVMKTIALSGFKVATDADYDVMRSSMQ